MGNSQGSKKPRLDTLKPTAKIWDSELKLTNKRR